MKKMFLVFMIAFTMLSCSDDSSTAIAPLYLENIQFSPYKLFFSTNGQWTKATDSTLAIPKVSQIDFVFLFNFSESSCCLIDPITRSQLPTSYSQRTWLSTAIKTKFYSTNLTVAQFEATKSDQSKIGQYFANTNLVQLASAGSFPEGTAYGNLQDDSQSIIADKIIGFQNVISGKRGLIWVISAPNYSPNVYLDVEIVKEK